MPCRFFSRWRDTPCSAGLSEPANDLPEGQPACCDARRSSYVRGGHGRALRGRAGRSTALGSGPFSVRSKMSQATGAAFTFRAEALPRGQGTSKRIVPQKRNETLGIPRPIRSRLRDGIVAVCGLAANSVECPAVPQTRDCALDRSCAVPPLSGLCGGGVRARCQ